MMVYLPWKPITDMEHAEHGFEASVWQGLPQTVGS